MGQKCMARGNNKRSGRNLAEAPRHTAIIKDPLGMWSKLAWDADCFRDIQIAYPDEVEPLCFAALNVCITAWSLRQWADAFAKQEAGKGHNSEQFGLDLEAAVPEQAMCDAIANSAKHARFSEERWIGGGVTFAYVDGDEDIPPGYVLYHESDGVSGFAVNNFQSLVDHWWTFLGARGWTKGHHRIPLWLQNKLNRVFADHIPALPDGAIPIEPTEPGDGT
jgi:hypothetical protein